MFEITELIKFILIFTRLTNSACVKCRDHMVQSGNSWQNIKQLKEHSGVFKPRPFIYMFFCVNDSYLLNILVKNLLILQQTPLSLYTRGHETAAV